jgi:hypothetical protein
MNSDREGKAGQRFKVGTNRECDEGRKRAAANHGDWFPLKEKKTYLGDLETGVLLQFQAGRHGGHQKVLKWKAIIRAVKGLDISSVARFSPLQRGPAQSENIGGIR